MRLSCQGYEGRNDSIRDLRCGRRRASATHDPDDTPTSHAPHRRAPSESKRAYRSGTNPDDSNRYQNTQAKCAENRGDEFGNQTCLCRTPDDDMTLLLGAPRASARPQDERSIAPSDQSPGDSIEGQCWGVMVNKWLIGIKRSLQTAPEGAPLDCEFARRRCTRRFGQSSENSASPPSSATPPASPRSLSRNGALRHSFSASHAPIRRCSQAP